jgi:predicted metalloprotease with PDZ domain
VTLSKSNSFLSGLLPRLAVVLLIVAALGAYQWSIHDHRRREDAAALRLDSELGVTVEPLDDDVAEILGLPAATRGLVITSVAEGRAATRAGLEPGDVIQQIGNHAIIDPESAVEALDADSSRQLRFLVNRRRRSIELELDRD